MNEHDGDEEPTSAGKRRRWFLGLEPIFEGGRKGKHAQSWDVEDELIAVAFLGDVTIDLSQVRSTPALVTIDAYAVLRDVDVLVAEGTHVELFGVVRGDLVSEVPPVPAKRRTSVLRVHGHSLLGDVTVRLAGGSRERSHFIDRLRRPAPEPGVSTSPVTPPSEASSP
jgi:hypothetical protein